MKLTWTFYPQPGLSVSLTVIYVPELDAEDLPSGGFLDVASNHAYVNWTTYRRFDNADVSDRRDAFQRLTPYTAGDRVDLPSGQLRSFTQPAHNS